MSLAASEPRFTVRYGIRNWRDMQAGQGASQVAMLQSLHQPIIIQAQQGRNSQVVPVEGKRDVGKRTKTGAEEEVAKSHGREEFETDLAKCPELAWLELRTRATGAYV